MGGYGLRQQLGSYQCDGLEKNYDKGTVCLFVLILYVPVNNLLVMSGLVFFR